MLRMWHCCLSCSALSGSRQVAPDGDEEWMEVWLVWMVVADKVYTSHIYLVGTYGYETKITNLGYHKRIFRSLFDIHENIEF